MEFITFYMFLTLLKTIVSLNQLAFSGGGSFGAVEIGILKRINQIEKKKYDIYTGISAGGLNAGFLSYYKDLTLGIKNAERTRVIARRNTAMANLNNTLAELEKCKNDYVEKQKTTERTGKYISETTRDNIALNNVVEDTYKQIYNAIIIENGVLTNKQSEISKTTATDNSKMENQIKQTNGINNIRVILFCFYYILVAFVISLFVYKNINIYSKVLFILILIAYPLFIYNVQYFLHTLWNSTYAYLRISVPENK